MKMETFPEPWHVVGGNGVGGLTLLALMTANELYEAVPQAQARGFFLAIGKRMAALEPLDGINDTSALSARLNAFWATLDWGTAEIVVGDDAITVHHHGLPKSNALDKGRHWASMLLAVVEGAYDAWFRMLGSGPALVTRASWKGDTFELHHGR